MAGLGSVIAGLFLLILSAKSQLFDGLPGCRTTRLELVFLVDGSSSVSPQDFNLAKEWIRSMARNFDISPATTRIAVIQYSSYPRTEFGLGTYTDIGGVARGLNRMRYMSGSTMTGLAIRYAIEQVFTRSREGAAKVVIVLSDGRSQDEVYAAARSLHSSGVATFAVGVGGVTSDARVHELREISSGPPEYNDNVFMVEDFRSISQIQRRLVDAVCEQTVQECPTAKHDLTFVIDVSSSIGYEDFKKVKNWMKKIVNAFDIGPDDTRVAVIMYSTSVQEVFNFNDRLSKAEMINAIDLMEYVMGDTHTEEAMAYMLNSIYTEANGDRRHVPDMAIVMTDGRAQEFDLVVEASKRVHEAGITVYAVGVGDDYRLEEVNAIASDPDEVFVIQALNFDIIELKRRGLVKNICAELVATCPDVNAEIVFLVDGSSSIGSRNFEKIKQWMKSIVDAFQIGPYYARVGVVQFTEIPFLEFGLGDYITTQATLQAIQNIRYRRGSTNIGRAIEFTLSRVFSATRSETPKILIILTDGESQDDVTTAANRARQAGVDALVFGVDNPQSSQLREMVSETDSVFRAAGFDEIKRLESKLISLICVKAEPECASQELDLHFLVDSSDSIGERNLEIVKEWMKNIVRSFDIGYYTTRVAVTQYANTVRPEFNLRQYATQREVEYAIDQLTLLGGATMTSQALEFIRARGFSPESGGRPYAPKVLIVVTDGRSGDHFEDAASRLHESGIYVFSIGSGFALRKPMEMISTRPIVSHVREPSSIDVINRYRRELVGEICRQTRPECPEAEMDLIFLVDGSNSVGRTDFETTKEWIISFVRQFEIGEYNTKIGVVQYASSVRTEIDIGAYDSKTELLDAIAQVEFAGGSTNTRSALQFIRSIAFSANHGARKDVPKVLIILTDGDARDQVRNAARQLSDDGVEVYAIGVGRDDVRGPNTDPFTSNTYHVNNYNAIKAIQSGLLRRVCKRIQPDCGKTATDLMFLVDSSTSVGADDWEVMKAFMQNVTQKFKLSNDFVRVGVVQYSTYPRTSIEMGNYGSKLDLRNALSRMDWQSGNTYTARALRYISRTYRNAPPRPNVDESKLLIVITDGQAQDKIRIIPAIKDLHNNGWRIFAIGIGEADLSELAILASNPDHDHLFYADNFLSTRKFQGRLTRLICDDPRHAAPEAGATSTSLITPSLIPPTAPGELRTFNRRQNLRSMIAARRGSRITRGRHHMRNSRVSHFTGNLDSINQPSRPNTTIATTTIATTVHATSNCATLWRDGRRVCGVDFLQELSVRKDAASSRASHKFAQGSKETLLSFRIKQGSIPTAIVERILPGGMPRTFSFVVLFRMHSRTTKDTWTLMSVAAPTGVTMFALSFNGNDKSMYITRSSSPRIPAQSVSLRGPLVQRLFDHNYHKVELIVEQDGVTTFIDCEQLPNRVRIEAPTYDYPGSVASFIISQRSSTLVDIQDLTLLSATDSAEECCELTGGKCAPSSLNSECGCLPEMKSAEVRRAESEEIRRIATEIANEVVEEKMNEFLSTLRFRVGSMTLPYRRPRTIEVVGRKRHHSRRN